MLLDREALGLAPGWEERGNSALVHPFQGDSGTSGLRKQGFQGFVFFFRVLGLLGGFSRSAFRIRSRGTRMIRRVS